MHAAFRLLAPAFFGILTLGIPSCSRPGPGAAIGPEPGADKKGDGMADLAGQMADPAVQSNRFWLQRSTADFATWHRSGVAVHATASEVSAELAPAGNELPCGPDDIDGGEAHFDAQAGLCAGKDPLPAGEYHDGISYYNGGSFYYGTLTSSPVDPGPGGPFDHLIASWNAATPSGTWLQFHVRAQRPSGWTRWYRLPV